MVTIKRFITDKKYLTNTFLIQCNESNEGIVIDPSDSCNNVIEFIEKNNIALKYLINTHTHPDHCSGNYKIYRKFKTQLLISKKEENLLNVLIKTGFISKQNVPYHFISDGDILKIGKNELVILETPGHTEGSISVGVLNNIFIGDLLIDSDKSKIEMDRLKILLSKEQIKDFLKLVLFTGHGDPINLDKVGINSIKINNIAKEVL